MASPTSDDELPLLPILPSTHRPSFSRPHLKKRAYSDFSDAGPQTSSDPPLFSSDDGPEAAGLENYEGQRKKVRHAGPWWRQPKGRKRGEEGSRARTEGLERNLDSGVWMGSDDTVSSGVLEYGDCQEAGSNVAVDGYSSFSTSFGEAGPLSPSRTSRDASTDPSCTSRFLVPLPRYRIADEREYVDMNEEEGERLDLDNETVRRELIHQVIALGDPDSETEVFHWSNEDRTSLSDHELQPLFTAIRKPKFSDAPPSAECFEPFTPLLQLYLANNLLTTLPSRLWDLEHLTVLSLRSNKLKELPPSIAKLRSLRELNISTNALRYLPWELSRLLLTSPPQPRLTMVLRGNPFFAGTQFNSARITKVLLTLRAESNTQLPHPALLDALATEEDPINAKSLVWLLKDQEQRARVYRITLEEDPDALRNSRFRFIATTPPTLFRFDGRELRGTTPAPSTLVEEGSVLPTMCATRELGAFGEPLWPTGPPPSASRVPSLLELAVRKTCDLGLHGDAEELGLGVDEVFGAAVRVEEESGSAVRACSVCGKGYVVARAEWIEYYNLDDSAPGGSGFVPFLRRACSWGCVLERMGEVEGGC